MRILFIGARIVGYRCLEALLNHGWDVAGLLTLSNTKAGITTAFMDFDDLIARYQISACRFEDLRHPEIATWVNALNPDLGIVIGVSQLIGEHILQTPRMGFIGMHPTLLPQGRGRAPIPWAIIKGLTQTGVSLFYCDPEADTGDLLLQRPVPVFYEDTSATLGRRTDDMAITLLLQGLEQLKSGTAQRIKQPLDSSSTWPKRRPEDGLIDWRNGSRQIYDWIRALTHPYPGAFTFIDGRLLQVWSARQSLDTRTGAPGQILARVPAGLLVATGAGNIVILRVQWDNEPEIDALDTDIEAGQVLGG